MSFARKVWHLLVAIKDGLSLVFLILFFWALFAVLNNRPSPAAVRNGALMLDLNGSVVEEVQNAPPLESLLSSAVPDRQYAAHDVIRAIDEAAKDDRIKAIALDMSTFLGGGHVHMQEIGEAMDRFRAANKPIYAYAVAYSDDSMLLAAHADEVWVDPLGGVAVRGPGGSNLYYGDLLKRFDVKAHVFRVGTYKAAVEPYIRNDMSPEARSNIQPVADSIWQEWLANVKQARPKARLDYLKGDMVAWAQSTGGDMAQAAIDAGLADKIGTREEWGERVAKVAGEDEWDNGPGAFANTDYDTWIADIGEGDGMGSLSGNKAIGVITIAGDITDGNAGPGEAGAARIAKLLDDTLDDDLAALVVRVDSPGGTITGSEAIRRAILRQKAKRIPIAVSMGNYAASGGYWVSTPADRIFAEPTTITGSIGVFGVIPSFEGLLADYGVSTDGVKTTPLSGQPDILGGFTPEAEAMLQSTVEFSYGRFISLVAQSRKLAPERVDEIGQGQVWDGGTARQIGLVDQFGDLDAALEWAAGKAGLKDGDWHPRFLVSKPSTFDTFIASLMGGGSQTQGALPRDLFGYLARQQAELDQRVLGDLGTLATMRGLQARCLECPVAAADARPRKLSAEARSLLARLLLD
ncbi:signal peptide peptidase SppA [Altererythrobacter salegens]|uniref:Signal peptide peptidase SppA n=1 Tax=Croceibacterium salegens TaxID=1737568 RepID=A0A6I4SY76_9SPHN|nr:signal peptide peptidase SppA [Croceibacterium salegens]MXO60971.1 signal peptide peptidase SppA [Croceibacterium salegens]